MYPFGDIVSSFMEMTKSSDDLSTLTGTAEIVGAEIARGGPTPSVPRDALG